jgi:hypothetical protein
MAALCRYRWQAIRRSHWHSAWRHTSAQEYPHAAATCSPTLIGMLCTWMRMRGVEATEEERRVWALLLSLLSQNSAQSGVIVRSLGSALGVLLTESALAHKQCCLYKHLSLWHPDAWNGRDGLRAEWHAR